VVVETGAVTILSIAYVDMANMYKSSWLEAALIGGLRVQDRLWSPSSLLSYIDESRPLHSCPNWQ